MIGVTQTPLTWPLVAVGFATIGACVFAWAAMYALVSVVRYWAQDDAEDRRTWN